TVDALQDFEFALYDIDEERLNDSEMMLNNLKNGMDSTVTVKSYKNRKEALRGAKYVSNAIQESGNDTTTITDYKVPKKYSLKQTIADTIGIGGIFRNLRTIPVMQEFAKDMKEVCPDDWLLNYTNPMALLTNIMLKEG